MYIYARDKCIFMQFFLFVYWPGLNIVYGFYMELFMVIWTNRVLIVFISNRSNILHPSETLELSESYFSTNNI